MRFTYCPHCASRLILGISDEMSSTGNIDRVKFITELVEKHNASC